MSFLTAAPPSASAAAASSARRDRLRARPQVVDDEPDVGSGRSSRRPCAALAHDEERTLVELDLDARDVAAVRAEIGGRGDELEGGRGQRAVAAASSDEDASTVPAVERRSPR